MRLLIRAVAALPPSASILAQTPRNAASSSIA
jgi:hypothetical protein